MAEKDNEKYSSNNEKKLMKNYFYQWNDQLEAPTLKREHFDPKPTKKRLVISTKILQSILAHPKYQWSLAA